MPVTPMPLIAPDVVKVLQEKQAQRNNTLLWVGAGALVLLLLFGSRRG